ncbi:MAG: hypothetical protein CMJ37_05270 [Phycisphaerae bacterium]|nr:hypothetical protein [Phycisphaerae bacterium]
MIPVSLLGWLLLIQDPSVSAYAERAGLVEIQRWALAETWRSTTGREREESAVRYATVLSDAFLSQPERAEGYREEAKVLLESLPKNSPARLRLEIELLAARALPIEQAASAALCSFEPKDLVHISVGLADVLEQAEQLLKRANTRFESAANTVVRSSSEEQRTRLSEFGGISESVRTRSALLAGWARTFRVLLGVSVDPARDRAAGLESFAWVLAGEPTLPDVSEISETWVSRRDVAFAIHGVLLLQSHAGLPDQWGVLLEQFGNADDRRRAGFRRTLARAIAQDPIGVRDRLVEVVEGQELVLLLGFLCRVGPNSVVEDVVQALIDRESLDDLLAVGAGLDLIELTNDDLAELIAAHLAYVSLLENDAEPEPQSASMADWSEIFDRLKALKLQSRPQGICHDTQVRAAWSAWKAGRFLESAEMWSKAAESGGDLADLTARRLQSLMRWQKTSENEDLYLQEYSAFLREFPGHPFSVEILLRQSRLQPPSLDLVEGLLGIPQDSPRFLEARSRAEALVFALSQSGSLPTEKHVELALELHRLWLDSSEMLDTDRTRAGLIRARRLLESARDRAEFASVRKEVLADLSDLRSRGMVGISDLGLELDFREVENAIASDDLDKARKLAQALVAEDSEGRWAQAANIRLVQWASRNPSSKQTPDILRTVGPTVLQGLEAGDTFDQLGLLIAPYFLPDRPELASEMLSSLRPEGSQSLSALILWARIFGLQGRDQDAVRTWSKVRAQCSVGSDAWCQSMVGEAAAWIRLSDPNQASRLLAQLRGLGPDPLPADVVEQLSALERSLGGTP